MPLSRKQTRKLRDQGCTEEALLCIRESVYCGVICDSSVDGFDNGAANR